MKKLFLFLVLILAGLSVSASNPFTVEQLGKSLPDGKIKPTIGKTIKSADKNHISKLYADSKDATQSEFKWMITGNAFTDKVETVELWMEEVDGKFVLDMRNQQVYIGDFAFYLVDAYTNLITGVYGAAEYCAAAFNEALPLVDDATSNAYYFSISNPGKYIFILDPEALTVTIEGTPDPSTYYFDTETEDFELKPQSEGSNIYTTKIDGYLLGSYIIKEIFQPSLECNYYGRNYNNGNSTDYLEPGVEFQLYNRFNCNQGLTYIDTKGFQLIKNPEIVFDAENLTLTIYGETVAPKYGIAVYGTIFSEDGEWMMKDMTYDPESEYYVLEPDMECYHGEFNIVWYEKITGLIMRTYGFYISSAYINLGEYVDFTYGNSMWLTPGRYKFTFNLAVQGVIVTDSDHPANPLNIHLVTGNRVDAFTANLMLQLMPMGVGPELDYTIMLADYQVDEESADFKPVEPWAIFTFQYQFLLGGLIPNVYKSYMLYVTAEVDGVKYKSNTIVFSLKGIDATLEVDTLSFNEISSESVELYYSLWSNLPAEAELFARVMLYDENGNHLRTDEIPLDSWAGTFTVDSLNPDSYYEIYITFIGKYVTYNIETPTYSGGFTTNKNEGIIEIDNTSMAPRYFNLNGIEVNNPANGLYIELRGTEARKVFIR